MRPEEESMAAIMDIKFCNIVVEILINNYDQVYTKCHSCNPEKNNRCLDLSERVKLCSQFSSERDFNIVIDVRDTGTALDAFCENYLISNILF